MKFIQKNKLELGDTLVPDLFIQNNMKSLSGNDIKVYMYILYLLKKGADVDSDIIVKDLGLSNDEVKTSVEVLQAEGLLPLRATTSQGADDEGSGGDHRCP